MVHILKNNNLEIHVDPPDEGYSFSRFDWTGKIEYVRFHDILVSSVETVDAQNQNFFGKGFYNEFGIDTGLGFDETDIGGWFHKIGVGLLKRVDHQYLFSHKYEVNPAEFKITSESDRLLISCKSQTVNGYAYLLKKEIVLEEESFTIKYYLHNTGEKDIVTDEYGHNFVAINNEWMGTNYRLKLPFSLKPELFGATVNPDEKVIIGQDEIGFDDSPTEPFFFSDLTGGETVQAQWELINIKSNLGIRETGSFRTNKVNLWGSKHVISPELFFKIFLIPGQSTVWSRCYQFFEIQ